MEKIYKLRAFFTSSISSVDRLNTRSEFSQFPITKFECGSFGRRGLKQVVQLQANSRTISGTIITNTNMEDNEKKKGEIQGPKPPKFSFPQWARWIVGALFTLLLPFLKLQWESKIQAIAVLQTPMRYIVEAEMVVEGVEKAAEVVEKVAEAAEKASEEVAESLPDGNNLKQAALWVEKASKATAHDAQLTQDFINKVEAVEQDLHDLEKILDPIIEKIVNGGPKKK